MIIFWGNGFSPNLSRKLATLGPIGYWGKMPGTNGSFVGLFLYTLFFHNLSPFFYLFNCLLLITMACSICTQAEIAIGQKDPSCVILDEVVAMPLCFIGLQPYMQHYPVWRFMLAGFLLFRLLDITKPFGINKLQALPGGQGVVLDDVAAALGVCLILHIALLIIT